MNNTFLGSDAVARMLTPGTSLYFVGIGGVSMSALAHLALSRGFRVAGCDRNCDTPAIDALKARGIKIAHETAGDPTGANVLIFSAAIGDSSPAVVTARELGIPLVSRADFLAALTLPYRHRVAVAGMHGKSTTVGMLAAILTEAGMDPTVLSGAPLSPKGDAWRIGKGSICLVEACEYRDSFLSLSPTLSIVTNMELDHPDYFPDLAAVARSFRAFLGASEDAVVGGDCLPLHDIAPSHLLRFGHAPHCQLRGADCGTHMSLSLFGAPLGALTLQVPGAYNRENALAAVAAACKLGVPFDTVSRALAAFRGIGRRMQTVGICRTSDGGEARVISDYAHHPTEMRAAIAAAREKSERVLVAFQPHTYSRTRALWEAFASALRLADYTLLLDIYAAREAKIYGTSSLSLAASAGVGYAPSFTSCAHLLRAHAKNGDTILVMGAGDIEHLVPLLADAT